MYRLRMDAKIAILTLLLEHGEEVKYRNRLEGYGLNNSSFDKYGKKISRRKFGDHKIKLLESRFIARLRYADKRVQYFSITPLGIIYLLNQLETIDKRKFHKTLEIINLFSATPHKQHLFDSILFEKLISTKPILARKCLLNAIKSVKIEKFPKHFLVYAMDPLSYDLATVYLQYSIDSSIQRHLDFFNSDSMKKVSASEFYHGIATHVFRHFHMQLFNKLKETSIPSFYRDEILSVVYPHIVKMREHLLQVANDLKGENIEMEFDLKVKSLNLPF